MLTFSSSSTAFLYNKDNILLLKRSEDKKIASNVWSGVGGKLEESEINDPLSACYREIFEESGIAEKDIINLNFRYLIIRKSKNDIRMNYIYFGNTIKTELIQTNEGILHWISKNEMMNREYTKTFAEMLKHNLSRKADDLGVYVGVAENENQSLHMNWSLLEDFENR